MIINKNNKRTINKKTILIVSTVILIILIIIVLINNSKNKKQEKYIQQEIERVSKYSAITDFQTMEEIALYLDCKLVKQEEVKNENVSTIIHMELPVKPYENQTSNRSFYEKLIQYSASVLKYKNFEIKDRKNDVSVIVYCNETTGEVEKYYINDIENYFDVQQNKNNVGKVDIKTPIKVNVTSKELNDIYKNNWQTDNIDLGDIETTYRNYNIYFNEGYEIRKINSKVFNMVFTDKYTGSVIDGINTKSNINDIEKKLGTPHFTLGGLVGYKCENMYIFFYNNQISIYPREEYDTANIASLIEQYKSGSDTKEFIRKVKEEWNDYDKYKYDTDFVVLQYSLKGLCIKYDSTTKKGAIFYSNYSGKACGNTEFEQYVNGEEEIPSNVYIEDTDLVFEAEVDRVKSLDDSSQMYNFANGVSLNTSDEFKVVVERNAGDGYYGVRFVSIGGKYPSSELRESISVGIWYDDYIFVYGVKGYGLFAYDARSRSYRTLVSGNSDYRIRAISGNVVYFDQDSLELF